MRLSTKRTLLSAATGVAIVFAAATVFLPAAAMSGPATHRTAAAIALPVIPAGVR